MASSAMTLVRIAFFAALLMFAQVAVPAEVAGVRLEDRIKLGVADLVLNGAGIRVRVIFNVYVGALYLTERKSGAGEILADKGAKRIALTLLRDVSARQLADAFNDGIDNNTAAAELEALKPRITELLSLFTDGIKGDVILIDYLPDAGTSVHVNGRQKGKPIAGEDFYRALLRIWLGERPVDSDLKKSMLGQGG